MPGGKAPPLTGDKGTLRQSGESPREEWDEEVEDFRLRVGDGERPRDEKKADLDNEAPASLGDKASASMYEAALATLTGKAALKSTLEAASTLKGEAASTSLGEADLAPVVEGVST